MWRTARCGAVNSFVCKMRSLCDPFLFLRAGPIVATRPLDWYDFETGVSSQVGRGRFGGPVFRCPKLAFTEYCGKRREKPSCRSPKKRPPPKPARMRQNLVDEARRRGARKRGGAGEVSFVPLGDCLEEAASWPEELLALDMSLEELASFSPRQAQVVESRFFGGMDVAETAALLGVSESAVERDWRAARAWLAGRICPDTE